MHTCLVKVMFKAAFQALHQFGDATSVFFNNAEFGHELHVLSLLGVAFQGKEGIRLTSISEGANKRIPDV